jgi:hypothetical protein
MIGCCRTAVEIVTAARISGQEIRPGLRAIAIAKWEWLKRVRLILKVPWYDLGTWNSCECEWNFICRAFRTVFRAALNKSAPLRQ